MRPPLTRSLGSRVLTRQQLGFTGGLSKSSLFASLSFTSAEVPPSRCVSGGGNGGGGVSGGGGGGGGSGDGSDGGDAKVGEVLGASGEVLALSSDVIVLDVGGMSCGGCAGKVKRILESQPHVSSANVILATETAIVWPVDDAKVVPNWQQELGETLAKHLTSCGFQSKLRGQGDNEEQVPQ